MPLDGPQAEAPRYSSVGHVAFIDELEFFLRNGALYSAPVAVLVDRAAGIRLPASFEARLDGAAAVIAARLASVAGEEATTWMDAAELLFAATVSAAAARSE